MDTLALIIILLLSSTNSAPFQSNYESVNVEKVYLHTDRNIYMAGDYLFFKLYLKSNLSQESKYTYMLIRNQNNKVVIYNRIDIINKISYGSIILPDTLSTGNYQIVCFTNLMRNDEDSFFTKEIVIANSFDEKLNDFTNLVRKDELVTSRNKSFTQKAIEDNLTINLEKQTFSPREKISFTVEARNKSSFSSANLSVSVCEIIPDFPVEESIMESFEITKNDTYLSKSQSNKYVFKSEYNGPILQGRIVRPVQKSDGLNRAGIKSFEYLAGYTLLLSTPDSLPNLQYCKADSLGSFFFNLNRWYEGKELYIRLMEDDNATIEIDNRASIKKSFNSSQKYNIQGIGDFLTRSARLIQVQKYYKRSTVLDTQKISFRKKTFPKVYYKQYLKILPSDFVELPDFVEISREILPGFKVRKKDENYGSNYSSLQYRYGSYEEPLIFLDGVPIENINPIIKLGTNQIKSIEIVPVVRYFGDLSFKGILSVSSKSLALNDVVFGNAMVKLNTITSLPLTKPEPFNPVSVTEHYPDLRQLLLWSPDLILNNPGKITLECFASDLKGTFRVNIEGVTANGEPLSGSAILTIR